MALCEVHWASDVLAKKVGAYVILPDAGVGEPPYPTYYLLHGLSDDYTVWQRRTRIEWYVRQTPLVVVMPDGGRGFYTDNEDGPAYATHFSRELVAFVERNFPVVRRREGRFVGGLSMGGYGALRLALGWPELFAGANSHSGALMHGSRNDPREGGPLGEKEFRRIFGDRPAGSDHDLLALARRAKERCGRQGITMPRLLIDCGAGDSLLEDNRAFHAGLTEIGVGHAYREHPGEHTWDYWDEHVRDALQFHTAPTRRP